MQQAQLAREAANHAQALARYDDPAEGQTTSPAPWCNWKPYRTLAGNLSSGWAT